jgi:hypothetical protein
MQLDVKEKDQIGSQNGQFGMGKITEFKDVKAHG